MDLACHNGLIPLQWSEPTNIQTPCIIIFYILCISIRFIEWISIPISIKKNLHGKNQGRLDLSKLWTFKMNNY